MDKRRRKSALSSRRRAQHLTLEEALEASWRENIGTIEVSHEEEDDDDQPLSALTKTSVGESPTPTQPSKKLKKRTDKVTHFLEMEYGGLWWTGIVHEEYRTKTHDVNQHHFISHQYGCWCCTKSSEVLSIHAPILGLNPRMVARASETEHISSHGCHSSTSRISVGNV
eukprot:2686368-Amphidinium_carterae.2